MTPVILALLFLAEVTSFPTEHQTAWMRPEAFHLELGMPRQTAESVLGQSRWSLRPGKEPGQVLLDYDDRRTVTMSFQDNRLQSIRFELVDFIPAVRSAFDEVKASLAKDRGQPDRETGELLIYEKTSPEIYVVVSTRSDSSFGQQGLGFLAVRYFLPPI